MPAKHCKALITFSIDPEVCKRCGICARKCPVSVISGSKEKPYSIDAEGCIKCGNCMEVCPFGAVKVE
jgi:NADH-quinone oxidoreductase subunit F